MCNTVLGAICLSSAAIIWGALYVVSKYVLDFIPPLTLVWLRYSIAFVFLYIILKIVQRKTDTPTKFVRGDWSLLAGLGSSDIFYRFLVNLSAQNFQMPIRVLLSLRQPRPLRLYLLALSYKKHLLFVNFFR